MSSITHECPECGVEWYCEGCDFNKIEALCGVCDPEDGEG